MNAAAHLGFEHESAEALAAHIKELLPLKDEAEQRKQFTKIVDALVACDLEHKYEELLDMASKGDGKQEAKKEDRPAKAAKADEE